MKTPLFFKSEPIIGESIQGYLSRLGKALNYTSHSWVFDVFPNRFPNRRLRDLLLTPDLGFLSDALRISPTTLDAMRFPQSGKNQFICRGQALGSREIRPSTSHYCPLCVRDHKTHLLIWNLSFVVACPIHNCALISHCNNCKRILDVDSIKANTCRQCRSKITAPACENPRLGFVTQNILSKVGGIFGAETHSDLPEIFETADIPTILSTIFCLGRAVEHSRRKGRSTNHNTIAKLLVDGYTICENWHERIQDVLKHQDSRKRSRWSPRFGFFRQHFIRSIDPKIRSMSNASLIQYRANAELNGGDPQIDADSHVRLRDIVQYLGVSERSLKNRMKSSHLIPVRRLSASKGVYVHIDEVERIRRSYSDCISCNEAATLLGIADRHLVRALYRENVFQQARSDVILDARARLFQKQPISAFCERITALEEREISPDVEVSWRSAKALAMSRHCRSVDFHRLVVDEQLRPVARLPRTQGFPGLIFLKLDVSEFEYETQPRLASRPSPNHSANLCE